MKSHYTFGFLPICQQKVEVPICILGRLIDSICKCASLRWKDRIDFRRCTFDVAITFSTYVGWMTLSLALISALVLGEKINTPLVKGFFLIDLGAA